MERNQPVMWYCKIQRFTMFQVFQTEALIKLNFNPFTELLEFFLNGAELSLNWAWFKDAVSHMCLAGAVVASWSLTQDVAEWQVRTLLL